MGFRGNLAGLATTFVYLDTETSKDLCLKVKHTTRHGDPAHETAHTHVRLEFKKATKYLGFRVYAWPPRRTKHI